MGKALEVEPRTFHLLDKHSIWAASLTHESVVGYTYR